MSEQSVVYGLPDPKTGQEVICPVCENIQWEERRDNDKLGWTCRACNTHCEDDKIHPLNGVYGAWFGPKKGI
jgi:hypothetical protein